jgi:S1-C subfamily serine protease
MAFVPQGQIAALAQASKWISPMRLLHHSPSQGYLGVDVADLSRIRAQALHMNSTAGAEITILDHDAPAGKSGLRVHDVIVAVNGASMENAEQFRQWLHRQPPGKKLRLSVNRDGAMQTITVQMADRRKVEQEAQQEMEQSDLPPGALGFLSSGDAAPSMAGGFHFWGLGSSFHVGALVERMTPEMQDYLGIDNGVIVKSVARHSAAAQAGLQAHDVILAVGAETVATTSDWERLLRASNGKVVPVSIQRDRARQTLWLQLNRH